MEAKVGCFSLFSQLFFRDKSVRVAPCVAYHGTSEQNVKGILETGFLLNKLSQGSGDNGWFGCGIYFSQHVQTAMGYCRGRQMSTPSFLVIFCFLNFAFLV
jgi:hypothetical protein